MPRVIPYTKGSIIYFTGDQDERIFILQKGAVTLNSLDIETGSRVTESIGQGEFFGVKSAFGHYPREEEARVLADSTVICMTVQEFEQMFSHNKALIFKMLRVFSNQLRAIHKKTESVLNSAAKVSQPDGMMAVAHAFFDDEKYNSCVDVLVKLLQRFPNSPVKQEAATLLQDAKHRRDLMADKIDHSDSQPVLPPANNNLLKQFELPAFARFAKIYHPGQVIISEYEPGDCFYLIQAGQVQLVKTVNGSNKNLDILMPSEIFGEMAILDNTPRSATCMALDTVKCLEFNKENFEQLIGGNPQMALILLKLFCKRIYDQKRRFKILTIQDTSARVGEVFVMFDELNPMQNPSERSRRFNLTVQDISHWAGLPIDDVREEIEHLVDKHKIEVYDSYIIVANMVDMKRMVDTRSAVRKV